VAAGAAAALAAVPGVAAVSAAPAASSRPEIIPGAAPGDDTPDLILTNGRIHTMDGQGTIAGSVAVKDGRIASVGTGAAGAGGATIVNLKGRTVIPGLIESHTHFVSLANRPGYHVADLELASSIAEVQALLAARRAVGDIPEGGFITAMGGWHPRQWAEQRQPTLAELDEAVSDRPVFLFQQFNGPARVNSLGKAFMESVTSPLGGPVTVAADGAITGAQALAALYHLRVRQTFEDKKRSVLDAMAFTAKIGVTTLLDQTLVAVATGPRDPQPTHFLANLDHFRMYDGWLAIHAEGKAFVRLQINFLHNQGNIAALGGLENQLPELRERLKNQFPFFGDEWVRTGGIGEWAAPFAAPTNAAGYAVWYEAQRLVAQAGWRNENAQTSVANIQQVVETYEAMDDEFGITDLRWGLQHADQATEEQLARLKELNCGVSTSGFRWLTGNPTASGAPVGPLFPQIVGSGVRAALHQDGVHIANHNAWFGMHYATTGLNVLGQQINPDQQISREEAMRGYTTEAAWYLNREDLLGSIEPGKAADLVVLDRNYFDVSDADARRTLPVMTIVGGKVVHDTGAV
jgi:hypothetical protein